MPQTPHIEKHFTGSEVVRDIVIGMSDGLTVPFALAAGLSRIANSTSIVITGGLAATAAFGLARLISKCVGRPRSNMVWNIPIACNRATADFMISSPLIDEEYNRLLPKYDEYRNRTKIKNASG